MAGLDSFLDKFKIDRTALGRVRKRVFVVGRFNQRDKDKLGVYLFTNSAPKGAYRDNFDGVFDMRYESFVQALRPSIAERVNLEGRFARVEQVVPTGDDAHEGASVIDPFNYFFQRAVANSNQPAFQNANPGLSRDLLQKSDTERGRAILTQIRKNLNTFCEFQPRTHEIVDAVSNLLGDCGEEHGMPAYDAGGALPIGFPEKLIDFVYAEDSRVSFKLDGLDLEGSGAWDKLKRDPKAGETFCKVVSAFRDALLNPPVTQFNDIKFRGQTLSKRAMEWIPPDLHKAFVRSRDAFNGLRQILQSRVLLSMILEWLLSRYYLLPSVDKNALKNTQSVGVEQAILDRWKDNDLAAPVKRPSPEEREHFSDLLAERFEELLEAITAEGDDAAQRIAKLPPELAKLATEVRADATRRNTLVAIAGAKLEERDLHRAFVDASKTILIDVLCPVLYKTPVVTAQKLKAWFKQESMAAYLTAIFLDDRDQDAVRRIAEDNLEFFESKINEATKRVDDVNEVMGRLLKGFLGVLSRPETERRLSEGIRVLSEIHQLLEASGSQDGRGPGSISATLPYAQKDGSLENTKASPELVKIGVRAQVERSIDAIMTAATPAAVAAGGAESTGGTGGGAAVATAAPSVAPAGVATSAREEVDLPGAKSPLKSRIDDILAKITDRPTSGDAEAKERLVNKVSQEILGDSKFVGGLTKDLRHFERILNFIYTRYKENEGKKTFRNKVERMTLVNMMLLFQKDLGLGKVTSNLYQLLLDLVLELDPETADPRAFMRKHSLTEYFDEAKLRGGITSLRQTLEVQGSQSLQNIVSFVSELCGVKYLLDTVSEDREAEVVVINGTAKEFLNWIKQDNLTEGAGKGRLRNGMLITQGGDARQKPSEGAIAPGLVYLTDIAFETGAKQAWIEGLADSALFSDKFSFVPPPMCLSTSAQDTDWEKDGADLSMAAATVPAPVFIVGPSFHLNPSGDGFPTVLPAGYPVAAHFLSRPEQRIQNPNVGRRSNGRFRVIGRGAGPIRESLETLIWGEDDKDTYALAADFYLYVILVLMGTASKQAGTNVPNPKEFYPCFYMHETVLAKNTYKTSEVLNPVLLGGNALRYALDQNPGAGEALTSVGLCRQPNQTHMPDRPVRATISQVGWFDLVRTKAGIP